MAFHTEILRYAENATKIRISSTDTTFDSLVNKLIAGTNMSIVQTNTGSNETLVFNAIGSGTGTLAKYAPLSGNINGNNTVFTFAAKPVVIVSDGMSYQENKGWTWSINTATMTQAPIYDIYGED